MCISINISQLIGGCELGSLSLTGALMSPKMFLSLELLLAEPAGRDKRAWSAHGLWHYAVASMRAVDLWSFDDRNMVADPQGIDEPQIAGPVIIIM